MPRDPEEEYVEVTEGEAPEVGEVSGEEGFVSDDIPDSVFDEKQRGIGKRRKPAGPPLEDEEEDDIGSEAPDVPPTTPAPPKKEEDRR